MSKGKLVSKDFVFKKDKSGKLRFIGDFESFYRNELDPWGQKGSNKRLSDYYAYSRKNLVKNIKDLLPANNKKFEILEVGCGLGYVSSFLNKRLAKKAKITGMDISPTAIKRAKKFFPLIDFIAADICSRELSLNKKYDCLIMSQILWYVLEKLPVVFDNFDKLLKKGAQLIFVNAFLKEQNYGKNIINGFDGLVNYVLKKYQNKYKIIKAEVDYSGRFLHDDGILILKKAG